MVPKLPEKPPFPNNKDINTSNTTTITELIANIFKPLSLSFGSIILSKIELFSLSEYFFVDFNLYPLNSN